MNSNVHVYFVPVVWLHFEHVQQATDKGIAICLNAVVCVVSIFHCFRVLSVTHVIAIVKDWIGPEKGVHLVVVFRHALFLTINSVCTTLPCTHEHL